MAMPSKGIWGSILQGALALEKQLGQFQMDPEMGNFFDPLWGPSGEPLREGSPPALELSRNDLDANMRTGENPLGSDALSTNEYGTRDLEIKYVEGNIGGILNSATDDLENVSRAMRMAAIAGKLDGTEDQISAIMDEAGRNASEVASMDDFNARVAAMFGNIELTNQKLMDIAQSRPDVFGDVEFHPVALEIVKTDIKDLMAFRDQMVDMQKMETPVDYKAPVQPALRPMQL